MATKARKQPKPIPVTKRPGDDDGTGFARASINPSLQAAATLKQYNGEFGDLEIADLLTVLNEQVDAAKQGGTEQAEGMLVAQARTLDGIFNNLARRAANCEFMENLDTYLKLALRAQSQCRATWEAVSVIKHPPMANYVGQANIAHTQQVNNAGAEGGASRTRKKQNLENELLERKNGNEWLDAGKAGTAGRADTELETVEAINRTEDT